MQIPTIPGSATSGIQTRMRQLPGWWWRARGLEFALLILSLVISRVLVANIWHLNAGDVLEYNRYAQAFWGGYPPLHSFPAEYPPLAIVVFSLTLLPPLVDAPSAFAFWMGLCFLAGYAGFLRYSRHTALARRRAITYAVYLFAGTGAVVIERFDLVPALVTLGALWLTQRRRFGYAYLLIGIGTLLKLYPAFLLPVVMIEHYRVMCSTRRPSGGIPPALRAATRWLRRRKPFHALAVVWQDYPLRRVALGVLICIGAIVAGFIGPLAVNAAGALSGFVFAGNRPLQIESMPASLLWIGTLFGLPAHPDFSFNSLNLVGPLDIVLKPLSMLALAGGCLLVYWRQAHGKLTVSQAFLACLAAVIVTNKIFSPQYLIWLMPIVAEEEGFSWLWLAVCLLTTLDFPILYQMRAPISTVPYTPAFFPVVALRNLLLLFVTVRAVFRSPAQVRTDVPLALPPEEDEEALPEVLEVEEVRTGRSDSSGIEPVLAH